MNKKLYFTTISAAGNPVTNSFKQGEVAFDDSVSETKSMLQLVTYLFYDSICNFHLNVYVEMKLFMIHEYSTILYYFFCIMIN